LGLETASTARPANPDATLRVPSLAFDGACPE